MNSAVPVEAAADEPDEDGDWLVLDDDTDDEPPGDAGEDGLAGEQG